VESQKYDDAISSSLCGRILIKHVETVASKAQVESPAKFSFSRLCGFFPLSLLHCLNKFCYLL
jgi:hypothetical protein